MSKSAILQEAKYLIKLNKKRFNRKFRRRFNHSNFDIAYSMKAAYKRNGEDMRGKTLT